MAVGDKIERHFGRHHGELLFYFSAWDYFHSVGFMHNPP